MLNGPSIDIAARIAGIRKTKPAGSATFGSAGARSVLDIIASVSQPDNISTTSIRLVHQPAEQGGPRLVRHLRVPLHREGVPRLLAHPLHRLRGTVLGARGDPPP